MRVICDHCQASYNVPDEKVQGKPFKFKCKKCGETVHYRPEGYDPAQRLTMEMKAAEVSGDAAASPQQAQAEAQPQTQAQPAQASAQAQQQAAQTSHEAKPRLTMEGKPLPQQPIEAQACWYLAYNKQKKGPLTLQDARQFLLDAELTGETYIWKAGFENWKRLFDVPEFSDLPDLIARKREEFRRRKEAEELAERNRLKALSETMPPIQEDPSKRKSFSELVAQTAQEPVREEKKVDLSALASGVNSPVSQPAQETTPSAQTEGEEATAAGQEQAAQASAAESIPQNPATRRRKKREKKAAPKGVSISTYKPEEKKRINPLPFILMGMIVLIPIATVLTLAYYQIIEVPGLTSVPVIGKYFEKETVDKYAELRDQWEMYVKIDEAKIKLEAEMDEAAKKAEEEARQKRLAEAKKKRKARGKRRGASRGNRSRQWNDTTVLDFNDDETMETEGELDLANLSKSGPLTMHQVSQTVNKRMGKIGRCAAKYRAQSPKGECAVRFRITRRGSVSQAVVTSSQFAGTKVGECIADVLYQTKFEKSGGSLTITYPFMIQ